MDLGRKQILAPPGAAPNRNLTLATDYLLIDDLGGYGYYVFAKVDGWRNTTLQPAGPDEKTKDNGLGDKARIQQLLACNDLMIG
jgi:hypothetical protein